MHTQIRRNIENTYTCLCRFLSSVIKNQAISFLFNSIHPNLFACFYMSKGAVWLIEGAVWLSWSALACCQAGPSSNFDTSANYYV
jgi:hypothetical protein